MNFKNLQTLFLKNLGIKQTIIKNTFWLIASMALSSITSVIVGIWLARHFGPADYGQWAFAFSFVTFFSVFVEFGFDTLIVREISRDKSKTSLYIDNIIVMKLILGLITLGFIATAIHFLSHDTVVINMVYLLGIYIVVNSFSSFFLSIFRANEMMQYETVCYGINGVVLVALVIFFILRGGSIITISYAYLGYAFVAVLVSLLIIWRYFSKFFLKINLSVCRKIFSEVWTYALAGVIMSFYIVDSVILGVFKSNEQVGWYSAAYRVPLFIQVIGTILWRSFFPKFSQKYKEGRDQLNLLIAKFSQIMHFLAWPFAFGGVLLAGKILYLLFGQAYLPGTFAFQMLILSMSVSFIVSIYQEPIKASDRPKLYLIGVGGGAALNVVLDFVLIPSFGLSGAAIATLIAQILVLIFMKIQLNKLTAIKTYSNAVIPLISSLIMAGVIYLYSADMNVIISILIGVIIYLILYFSLFFAYRQFLDSGKKKMFNL